MQVIRCTCHDKRYGARESQKCPNTLINLVTKEKTSNLSCRESNQSEDNIEAIKLTYILPRMKICTTYLFTAPVFLYYPSLPPAWPSQMFRSASASRGGIGTASSPSTSAPASSPSPPSWTTSASLR